MIRPARADDAVAIAALDAATWSFDVTPSPRSSVPSSTDGVLVAEAGGDIVDVTAIGRSCGFVVEGVRRDEFLLDGRYVDDMLMARDLSG